MKLDGQKYNRDEEFSEPEIMITGNIKSQIDQIWNAFWSGGISNPLEVIEQITYLLFLRRHTGHFRLPSNSVIPRWISFSSFASSARISFGGRCSTASYSTSL